MSDSADQRQRTIDSLNTSIETWAESTGRRDDPVKSTGGMFFDPAELTFGEYAWNRLNAADQAEKPEKRPIPSDPLMAEPFR